MAEPHKCERSTSTANSGPTSPSCCCVVLPPPHIGRAFCRQGQGNQGLGLPPPSADHMPGQRATSALTHQCSAPRATCPAKCNAAAAPSYLLVARGCSSGYERAWSRAGQGREARQGGQHQRHGLASTPPPHIPKARCRQAALPLPPLLPPPFPSSQLLPPPRPQCRRNSPVSALKGIKDPWPAAPKDFIRSASSSC